MAAVRCVPFEQQLQDASTDGRRSSFAFLVGSGSAYFLAISDQTDVGISSELYAGLGFFGPPNAALPDPPCGEVCPVARPGGVGSVSMFCNVHRMI